MEYKIRNKHSLSKKEIKDIFSKMKEYVDFYSFDKNSEVEIGEFEGKTLIILDNEPLLMYYKDRIFFTLYGLNKYKMEKYFVTIDSGAVRFVTNGADVMAPGIVDADKNIKENDIVWICDEKYRRPLAIGIALMSGEKMIKEEKGRAVEVMHYVGDNIWNLCSKLD